MQMSVGQSYMSGIFPFWPTQLLLLSDTMPGEKSQYHRSSLIFGKRFTFTLLDTFFDMIFLLFYCHLVRVKLKLNPFFQNCRKVQRCYDCSFFRVGSRLLLNTVKTLATGKNLLWQVKFQSLPVTMSCEGKKVFA